LSTKTALTPSAKSLRREDLRAMRYSVFITPLSWVQQIARGTQMLINYNPLDREII